jgi:DNA-binding MarR family transcriptional regulator
MASQYKKRPEHPMKPSTKLVAARGVEAIPYQSRVAYLLGAIANLIDAGGSRLFRRAFGIGLGEARLVYVIGYEGPLTARQASQIIGVDKGAMSRTVAALVHRGYLQVTVDAADARQRVIQFTPAGKKLHQRVMTLALERERQMYAIFSDDELKTLSALLKRFRAHIPTVRTLKPLPFPPAGRAAIGPANGAGTRRKSRR